MTKDELKARLTELNIEFPALAKKDELEALLPPEEQVALSEKAEVNSPVSEVGSAPEAPKAAKAVVAAGRKPSWPAGWTPTGDKIADTKYILDHAPKVSFLIPLAESDVANAEETVEINGYKYTIKKGNMVTIPQPVADLLMNKYRVEREVAQKALAFANQEKIEALT